MHQALNHCLTVSLLLATLPASSAFGQSAGGSGFEETAPDRWQQLASDLSSTTFRVRQRAFEELVSGGAAAVPAVVNALLSSDAETRSRAITILERLPDRRDRAATRLARSLLEEQAATTGDQDSRRARLALSRLRDGWTQQAIDEVQQWGGTVQRANPLPEGGSPGFQIQLGQAWVGGADRMDLLLELEPIRWLSIEKSNVDDDGLQHIAKLTELRKLYLGNSRVTGVELARLAPLKQLDYLSLKQLPIDDEDLARLPELPQLSAIGLDQTSISDQGLIELRKFPRLEVLWLDHTKVTDAGLEHLQPLTSLRTLYLQGIKTPGQGLARLEKLENLQYISLKGATLGPDSLKQVARLSRLETLGLDHSNVTDEQLAELVDMPELHTLWLSKTEISDASVQHLSKMSKLMTLYLHGAKMTSEGANALRAAKPNLQVFR